MCEFGSAAPKRELQIGRCAFRNQLDHCFGGLRASKLGEEDGGLTRAAKIPLQRKRIVDDLAFVLFPGKAHHCTSIRRVLTTGECDTCIRRPDYEWARLGLVRG